MAPVRVDIRRARPLLGTFVDIRASGAGRDETERAVDAAFAAIADVHRLMSFHDDASDVSRINRAAALHPVAVDASTFAVLQTALEVHRHSGGAFDIAVAPVLQDLGLLPPGQDAPSARRAVATSAAIELLAANRVAFRAGDMAVDLGGIAKGFAVDRALKVLESAGIASAIVNAGGDLATFGAEPQSIGIRDPRDAAGIIARVALCDRALASSGRSFDPLQPSAATSSAVIDPHTRRPAGDVAGATVVAPTCMIADALTKVVMISGANAAPVLEHFAAAAMMVLASGEVRVTSNWNDLVPLAA